MTFDSRTAELLVAEGIDVEGAMNAWARGHERLYMKYLLRFPDDPYVENFVEALETGDLATAYRAIHSLKGVSANLGMTKLHELCEEGTTIMKDPNPQHQKAAQENGQPTALVPNPQADLEPLVPQLRDEMRRMMELAVRLNA